MDASRPERMADVSSMTKARMARYTASEHLAKKRSGLSLRAATWPSNVKGVGLHNWDACMLDGLLAEL